MRRYEQRPSGDGFALQFLRDPRDAAAALQVLDEHCVAHGIEHRCGERLHKVQRLRADIVERLDALQEEHRESHKPTPTNLRDERIERSAFFRRRYGRTWWLDSERVAKSVAEAGGNGRGQRSWAIQRRSTPAVAQNLFSGEMFR